MTAEEFRKKNHVRDYDKHCGNCRHGRDLLDDGVQQCVHGDLDDPIGLFTYAEQVCDKWEGTNG